jgi:hypothetical protein
MRSFNEAGVWWLPEAPGRLVAGILDFKGYGPVGLDLLGTWQDEPHVRLMYDPERLSEDARAALLKDHRSSEAAAAEAVAEATGDGLLGAEASFPQTAAVVHGVVHGAKVTLLELLETRRDSASIPGFPRHGYSVGAVLRGEHTGPRDDEAWTSLHVRMEHLAAWSAGALLVPEADEANDNPLGKSRVLSCDLAGNGTVQLGYRGGTHIAADEHRRWREPEFLVRFDHAKSLDSLMGTVVRPLQDLLTTASGIPAAVTGLDVAGPEYTWSGHGVHVEVGYAEMTPSPDGASRHPGQMALPLEAVDYGTFLPSWFAARERHRVAAQFAYAQRYHRLPYGEEKLIMATAAAEALHGSLQLSRRTAVDQRPEAVRAFLDAFPEAERELLHDRLRSLNTPTFLSKLEDLLRFVDPWFNTVLKDSGRWAYRVKKARNDVAHGNEGATSASSMLALAAGVGHLVELCLLRAAGASRNVPAGLLHSKRHSEVSLWTARYLPDC